MMDLEVSEPSVTIILLFIQVSLILPCYTVAILIRNNNVLQVYYRDQYIYT